MSDYPPMQDEYFHYTPAFPMWRIKQTSEDRYIVERRWCYWPIWTDVSTPYMPPPTYKGYPLTTLEQARERMQWLQCKDRKNHKPKVWYV